jgi:hypothetical protein
LRAYKHSEVILNRFADLAVTLACRSSTERVAQFLLSFHQETGSTSFDLPMARRDIADHLGIRSETLSRCLAQLVEKGMVRLGPGQQVSILDVRALRAVGAVGRRRPSQRLDGDEARRAGRAIPSASAAKRPPTLFVPVIGRVDQRLANHAQRAALSGQKEFWCHQLAGS